MALHVGLVGLLAAALVAAGFVAQRRQRRIPRPVGWTLLPCGLAALDRLLLAEPPALRMGAFMLYTFALLKAMVVEEERRDGMPSLSARQWLAFATGWVGMRPRLFLVKGAAPGARTLAVRGILRLATGLLLVGAARLCWSLWGARLAATLLLCAGLSLVVHFGACTLLAAFWRARGVRVDAVFRAPVRSQSLAEFWARRWNLAYSEMCGLVLYRPLAGVSGRGAALFATFLFSGLLHEMAISLPVRAGFGLPFLYFMAHGVLVLVEGAWGRLPGRAWTVFWIVAPLPILFHRPFVAQVLWPLLGIS
jgi:alginate O-acetyltransferase complex protein AlgI